MPFTVTMPKLSPTMEEGTIAKWCKKEGEYVDAGEVLLEITTDKATVEHTTLDEGWLRKILISEGSLAHVNKAIAIFTTEEKESVEGYQPEEISPEPPLEIKVEIEQPEEVLAPSRPSPTLQLKEPAFIPESPLEKYIFPIPSGPPGKRIKASPLARRLAKEHGLDLSTVKGTGPDERITSKDLKKAAPMGLVTFGRLEKPTVAPGTYEEIPLTPIRKIIARRLQESKSFIPHFYVKQIIDAEALVNLRNQLKNLDLKVTFNDMVIRASALALRKHPEVNAGFNSVNQTIIRFKTIDISVAVSIDEGLITPIIRHADYKNLGQISLEISQLVQRARQNKLQEHEYKGGSFCLSNLGMYGITEFTAVINPPQAAILAIGGIEDRPVVKEGNVVSGKTLALTLSADHRVIDGAYAAQYLKTVQQLLENTTSRTL